MTFSASSIDAWWRCVGAAGLPSGRKVEERIVSRFQFARPAVVFSFLDQIIWMPPVEEARREIWPEVILLSSSVRKEVARVCFFSENAFLASFARRPGFVGLFFAGEKRRASLGGSSCGFGLGWSFLGGEYSSFQSFTTSWLQKLSMLGRWGEMGIRGTFFGDNKVFGFSSGLPGGVVKCVVFDTFLGLFSDGELARYQYISVKIDKDKLTIEA